MEAEYFLWVDLEMTGLDDTKDQIIEIAVIMTDRQLNIVAEGPSLVIQCPESLLQGMDDWCTKTHTASGLVDKVRASSVSLKEAEDMVLQFARQYVP